VTNRGLGIWNKRFYYGRSGFSRGRLQSKENKEKATPPMARLRNKLSALVLWCALLALYLGGAVMLVIGLVFASREWWAVIHQHAGLWVISTKTAEVLVLAVGLILILIAHIFQGKSVDRSGIWRTGRRSDSKGRQPFAE
jgi:heme/copper-type cytochrome/quinol oxidase subunit 1